MTPETFLSHFAQGEVRTPGGSGAHTPGCAVARQ